MNYSSLQPDLSWPRIEEATVIEDGKAVGILLREFDGTISAIRIGIEQLAD
jgi:hypothetical protein